MGGTEDVDYLIIGGGFYGCCLALFLRSISARVVVVERAEDLLTRASRANQARIHTGFHYPRSALTAVKSRALHRRFMDDFPEAVVDDFQMLYAIARRRSKVSAKRFYRMFRDLGAPIAPAAPRQAALFNDAHIEAAFACTEAAFDYAVLRRLLHERISRHGVDLRAGTEVVAMQPGTDSVVATLSDGSEIRARYVFNVTYARTNTVLALAGLPPARLKHEVAEIAVIAPPPALHRVGVTVMDGPFFSTMPFPAERLYSLTHVRYTPHASWIDGPDTGDPYARLAGAPPPSNVQHMLHDGRRYLPCLADARPQRSIFEIKTVLLKNEQDDGRPILYHQKPADCRVVSILGGKLDNIYDLFDLVRRTGPEFAGAHDALVRGGEA